MLKKIVFLFSLLAGLASASAAIVRGTVVDETGEPLSQATVRLLSASDSTYLKGTATDMEGRFTLNNIKNGRYIVEGVYLGYRNGYINIKVADRDLSLQPLALSENSVMLEGVSVIGTKTPVTVKEDTVEFNADSYKTAPNAVMEELLKKLPGVEVGSDGKITANGKDVSKILVDGKEFFSDDPTVASRNLPADMINKLQVVDRKSDLARMTGVDDGEEETVINITIKKGMNDGWFGFAEAGYGTDKRYMGSFNINRFWNGNQLTFLGNANNINQLGFTDDNGNRFRRFGGDNGITTSQAFGVNFNVGNKEIFRVGGNVMWSRSEADTHQSQERDYAIGGLDRSTRTGKYTLDKGQNIRADFRMQWKPDSFNSLDIAPRISWNHNHSFGTDSTFNMGAGFSNLVSRSLNTSDSRGNALEFGARVIYNHNFRNRPGRSFSIMANFSHNNTREKELSLSRNRFYEYNDSVDDYDQKADNHTWNNSLRARVSWTEPLGNVKNGNYLTFAYGINSRWNDADKLVYDLNPLPTSIQQQLLDYALLTADPSRAADISEIYDEVFNPDLSNRFRNDFFSQDIRIGYKHVDRKTNLEAGLSAVPSMSRSVNLIDDAKSIPTRWVWNYAPFLRYRYRISKATSLQVNYRGRSTQPSMTQLQPVADVSDPLRVVIGNPNLDPSFIHNLQLRFQDFNADAQRSIMLMANVSLTQNSIVSNTTFDNTTGGQVTTYENVNGVWSARLMNMISMPLRNKKWMFSNHAFGMYNRNVGFSNSVRTGSNSFRFNEMPAISFRPDNLDVTLRGRYSLQLTNSTNSDRGNTLAHSYGGTLDITYTAPFGLVLNSELDYTATTGYSSGYNQNNWMWNASIAYRFLRDRSLTLMVKAYDLLGQKSNIRRNEGFNYIEDIRYNTLTRYFMVTLSYRFNTFGKGKQPSAPNIGPGPGGHMGPPPGGMGGGRPRL